MDRPVLRVRFTALTAVTLTEPEPPPAYPRPRGTPAMPPPHTLATAEQTALLSSLASHGAATVHTMLARDAGWTRESALSVVHSRGIRITYSEHGAALTFHVRGGMSSGQPGLGLVHLPYTVSHEVVAHTAAALAAYTGLHGR